MNSRAVLDHKVQTRRTIQYWIALVCVTSWSITFRGKCLKFQYPVSSAYHLYLHSAWGTRTAEFAFYLYLIAYFKDTLLPSSIFGFAMTRKHFQSIFTESTFHTGSQSLE